MSYFPVDDDFTFHPKVLLAGNEACGVWVRAGAWSKKHVTGGFIPTGIAESLGDARHALAAKLVTAGLWEEVEGGYRFHDWEQQAGNADAATEKARREQSRKSARERQARARAAKVGRPLHSVRSLCESSVSS